MSAKQHPCAWLKFYMVTILAVWGLACASAPPRQEPQPPPEAKATAAAPPAEAQTTASPLSVPSLPATTEQAVTKESAKTPPPSPEEIKSAVGRVFDKAASADTEGRQASSLVGDFNGDGSEDLAVVVTPSDSGLGDINSEVANWTLEDPANVGLPSATGSRPLAASKRVQAEKGKTLLAIIHGVGPHGWRSSEAKQSYLLKNGAGNNMTVQPAARLRSSKDKVRLPPLRGDVIQETVAGKRGLLLWNGAKYAWYIPQSQADEELH